MDSTIDNMFVRDWKESQYEKLKVLFPELTKEQLMEVLDEDVEENFQDRDSMIHNDYQDDMELRQPLTTVYRFIKQDKPVLAGNGTLFYNQDRAKSPIADLIDNRMDTRKMYKDKLKETLATEGEGELSAEYDMKQMEAKVRINSIYGSFGAPTFRFYNKYTAASTTGTAQSLISATGISFEAFVGDHVLFKTFGECIDFIFKISQEEYEYEDIPIKRITDPEVIYERLKNNFEEGAFHEEVQGDLLIEYIENLGPENWTKIYYKNNLYAFIDNDCISGIICRAFEKVDNFNDPNKVPEPIKEDMELLWEYCREWVFFNHSYNEQIRRLKKDKRKSVKLIDTDSNLIYVQPWVDHLKEHIVPKCNTSMIDEGENRLLTFACVNTLTYMITAMLKELLDKFCGSSNVLERFRPRINMKNEFCFLKLLLAPTKKRYSARMVLREGIPVNKTEIKGYDFKKAGVTEYVTERMTSILTNRILNCDEVDIVGMLRDLDETEKEIHQSLRNGERSFLLRMNCKEPVAYKNPDSMGQVLSVLAWNTICPDDEIMVPDKLDVCLMKIPNEEALEPIRLSHPEEYDRINRLLLHGPNKSFREKGVKYIAIPNNIDRMPDWMIPLIDYDYISSRNLGTFNPILNALGLPPIGSNQQTHFGNVRFNRNVFI